MSHSPEPWTINEYACDLYVEDAAGNPVTTNNNELKNEMTDDNIRRIVACVNACRGIPTDVVGEVLDHLFTAMMVSEARRHTQNNEQANYLAMLDLNAAAVLIENAGVDLTDWLSKCRLTSSQPSANNAGGDSPAT